MFAKFHDFFDRDMRIHTRPSLLWWSTSGDWWTVSQRLTLWKHCRNLERSGREKQHEMHLFHSAHSRHSVACYLDSVTFPVKCVLVEFTSSNPKLTFVFSYVVVMPKKRQALVEYEDMNGSSTAVTYAADNQVYIAGHPAFINYSTSQKISRPGDSDDSRSVNNVLLLTIMNPIYPITTVNTKTCVTVCLLT